MGEKEDAGASTQIAVLSQNADGVSFDVLKQELKENGDKGLYSRQACDSLFIYFHDLAEQGADAEIDYHFLGNLLNGEGGKTFVLPTNPRRFGLNEQECRMHFIFRETQF